VAVHGRGRDLAALATHGVHARVERRIAALGSIHRQRTRHRSGLQQSLGQEQTVERQRGRHLRAIDECQAFLGGQRNRLDAGGGQCGTRRRAHAVHTHVALAQQGERHVRERRQIARCANGTLGRNARHDAGVQQCQQRVDHDTAHARIAARQTGGLHQQHQPRDVVAQVCTRADGVREDEVALQALQLVRGDLRLGQQAEPGVDAVGRVALGNDGLHGGRRRFDGGRAIARQRNRRRGEPDAAQVGEGHFARLQRDDGGRGHGVHSNARGCL
ncbi:hypothetical protein COLO4_01203, partial [Corchorus olitorius]